MSLNNAEEKKELFKFNADVEHLRMYFDFMKSNQQFYVPVYRTKGGKVSLYFSRLSDFHFGQCRFFMEKTHCDQWCHDVYMNNEEAKVMSLSVPAKKLISMIEYAKEEQSKVMAPCIMRCCVISNKHYFTVDDLYSDEQLFV